MTERVAGKSKINTGHTLIRPEDGQLREGGLLEARVDLMTDAQCDMRNTRRRLQLSS